MSIADLTADLFKPGSTFESEGFFQGIDPSPCVWKVDGDHVDVFFLGIRVATYKYSVKKGKVALTETSHG